jgi:quercetin dioxygenase-like cupin family protein
MLSRRRFSACAICAAVGGFVATGAAAQGQPQGQPSGLTRKVLSERDVPNSNYKAVQVAAEIAAGFVVARHTHPGIESAYVLEGEAELSVDGQPDRKIQANDAFQIPPNTPHGVRNGGKATKLAITYVVEKDKPLASPA